MRSHLEKVEMFKELFSGELGKEILRDLAIHAGAFTTSHVPGDPYSTAYNEGRRSVFNYISNMANQDVDLLKQRIVKEQETARQDSVATFARDVLRG